MTDTAELTEATAPSPYERIGGAPSVKAAVERLYELILADDELAPYFASIEMPQLKAHMAALLTKVLGGPDGYAGRDLGEAHHGLGITTHHYQLVTGYLVQTLQELSVPADIIAAAGAVVASVAPTIIEKPEPTSGQDG